MKAKSIEYSDEDLLAVHRHTTHNREEIEHSQICYCICCRTFFKPEEIEDYTDRGTTAICPYCDCDAVIGEACGQKLTDVLLDNLHKKYFGNVDIEDTEMEIYIATDLLFCQGAYRFNAIYAFKSKTSIKSYKKYLKTTGENHNLVITSTMVSYLDQSLHVITEFDLIDGLPEYKTTTVINDFEDACDYVANIKETQPSVEVEHDIVRIHSHFTPSILHDGWT